MKKQVQLKATETAATNKDFYNLFRPIAPGIDLMGKVAQVISALTEAITIWYITQSELAQFPKMIAITVSVISMLLVVAILELGGRKFLQVLTRALIWKKLQNAWYIALFSIVSLVTVGIIVISFRLSTNGIHHAFVSKVSENTLLDDSAMKSDYRNAVKEIKLQFDKERELVKESNIALAKTTTGKYDAQIKSVDLKVAGYRKKLRGGATWAGSHVEKYEKQIGKLQTEKAASLAVLTEVSNKKLDNWLKRKNNALDIAKDDLNTAVARAETSLVKVQKSKFKNAAFWGTLFSFFVGFSVILAFVCIISVEVFRRGSGIEVEYQEMEKEPSIFEMLWFGIRNRFGGFFRRKVAGFAQIAAPRTHQSIGFNHSAGYASAQSGSFDEE